jgi:hypothetical protein
MAGRYRGINFAGSGFEALARALLAPRLRVTAVAGGGLEVDLGTATVPLRTVAPGLLHASWDPGRDQYFAFFDGGMHGKTFLHWGVQSYERIGWWQSRETHLGVLAAIIGGFTIGLCALGGAAFVRSLRPRTAAGSHSSTRATRLRGLASTLAILVSLVSLGGMTLVALEMVGRYQDLVLGLPTRLVAVGWIPTALLLPTAALVVLLAVWRSEKGGGITFLGCLFIAAAGAAFEAYGAC